ncbi:MAG: TRAP transporter small permease [Granulosicoccus sp.]
MQHIVEKLETAIVGVSRLCLGLSFVVLIVAVLIQVLGRMFAASPVWTEELTRFALLYLCAFGIGLAWRSGDLVNVDIVCESLPGQWPRRLRLVVALISCTLCGFLLVPAWKFVSIGAFQTSPAMSLQMTYVHLTVFILLASLAIFSLLRVLSMLFGKDDGLAINRRPDL